MHKTAKKERYGRRTRKLLRIFNSIPSFLQTETQNFQFSVKSRSTNKAKKHKISVNTYQHLVHYNTIYTNIKENIAKKSKYTDTI